MDETHFARARTFNSAFHFETKFPVKVRGDPSDGLLSILTTPGGACLNFHLAANMYNMTFYECLTPRPPDRLVHNDGQTFINNI